MAAIQAVRLNHVVLYVADLERSVAFYDAAFGKFAGDDAVYKVVEWNEGTFEIDFSGKSSQRRTTRSTQGLLMEALRILDESRRDQV